MPQYTIDPYGPYEVARRQREAGQVQGSTVIARKSTTSAISSCAAGGAGATDAGAAGRADPGRVAAVALLAEPQMLPMWAADP